MSRFCWGAKGSRKRGVRAVLGYHNFGQPHMFITVYTYIYICIPISCDFVYSLFWIYDHVMIYIYIHTYIHMRIWAHIYIYIMTYVYTHILHTHAIQRYIIVYYHRFHTTWLCTCVSLVAHPHNKREMTHIWIRVEENYSLGSTFHPSQRDFKDRIPGASCDPSSWIPCQMSEVCKKKSLSFSHIMDINMDYV